MATTMTSHVYPAGIALQRRAPKNCLPGIGFVIVLHALRWDSCIPVASEARRPELRMSFVQCKVNATLRGIKRHRVGQPTGQSTPLSARTP
jgi:hypothetical protein